MSVKITMEIEVDCKVKFKTKYELWEFCRSVLSGNDAKLRLFSEKIPMDIGPVRGIRVKLPRVKRS